MLTSDSATKNDLLLQAAQAALDEGFAIFPLTPDGKQPLSVALNAQGDVFKFHNGVHSSYSASFGEPRQYTNIKTGKTCWTTPALEAWLDGLEVNYAVALELSGLCVMDVDSGIDSEDELKLFCSDFGILPTRFNRSGRVTSFAGHLYFLGVMQSGSFAIPWHNKIVRGEIKSSAPYYTVGEGSFHKSGNRYVRLWDFPMAATPVKLFADILQKYPGTGTKSADPAENSAPFEGDAITCDEFESWAEKVKQDFVAAGFNKSKNAYMYVREGGCPWQHLHECDNHDSDFAVFVPLAGKMSAKCVHESCKEAWTTPYCWTSFRAWAEKELGMKVPLQKTTPISWDKPSPLTPSLSVSIPVSIPVSILAPATPVSTPVTPVSTPGAKLEKIVPSGHYSMPAEEWAEYDFSKEESEPLIGTPENAVVRPHTKNLIIGAEKSFKTSFLMRVMAGLAAGETVFPELPAFREDGLRVVYIHAELNPHELKQRVIASIADISTNEKFINTRDVGVHLIDEAGQQIIRDEMDKYKPDILCLDPWAELISGYDENSAQHTSFARKFIDHLLDDYGATAFLTQHTGMDESRGGRGHTGMKGWRDTQFVMKRSGTQYVNILVEPRWGSPVSLSLKWEDGTLSPAVVVLTEKQIAFVAFLKEHPEGSTSQQIADALNVKQDTMKKFLQRSGQLFTKQGDLYFPKMDSEPGASNG